MSKKAYTQSCRMQEMSYQKNQSRVRNVSPAHNKINKKELVSVFNRFYKEQVADLYKAVRNG